MHARAHAERLAAPPRSRRTYATTFGPTYAFRHTVEKRSYSRYCGSTSDETERNASGNSSRTISATRGSCSGLRNENRKQTATASTPASFSLPHLLARPLLVERHEHRAVPA